VAQALSKQTTDTIGMVTPFSTDIVKSPYYEGLITGIIEGMNSLRRYDLKWIMIRDEEREKLDLENLLQEYAVDGLIFLSWQLFPKLVKESERRANISVVLINDYYPKIRTNIVYCEDKIGVTKLCAYLTKKRYRSIGIIRGSEATSHDARHRFLAFKACAKRFGFTTKKEFTYKSPYFDESVGQQIMNSWIKTGKLPRAIFCTNDDLARGAIAALRTHRIPVPGRVAIAGYDGTEHGNLIDPPLTSVRQPLEAMGRGAVELLAQLISKKAKAPIQLKFEPELIIRKSA
jgi:DNA-binding LacI/PurR family transcriptional regulator